MSGTQGSSAAESSKRKSEGDDSEARRKKGSAAGDASAVPAKLSFGVGSKLSSADSTTKPKTVLGLNKPKTGPIKMSLGGSISQPKAAPIKMSLGGLSSSQNPKPKASTEGPAPVTKKLASVFNPDEESDEEEMPPEAKMRMKNVGRNTPTAAGPNSYGKGKLGFCDSSRLHERMLNSQAADKS